MTDDETRAFYETRAADTLKLAVEAERHGTALCVKLASALRMLQGDVSHLCRIRAAQRKAIVELQDKVRDLEKKRDPETPDRPDADL